MATRRARRPYRWLRRGVLLILVLVLAGVVGLYWFGRQQRQPPPPRSEPLATDAPTAQGVATVGRGFEYTHYEEGRKRFTLRALRTLEDREETVFLEGVDLLVFEEEGRGYELSANHARYNRERQQALLEGDVRLGTGGDVTLETEGLELSQEGRLITSTEAAEIVYGGAYRAVGNRFRVHVPEDLFLLTGDVRVDEVPGQGAPFSLRCDRLQFERDRQMLRADGGVEIERPDSWVTAQSVNAFLTEDLSAVRFLRARWEVEGYSLFPGRTGADGTGSPPSTRVDFAGRSLSTLIRPDGSAPESSQLEGTPAEPAVIRTTDGTGVTRVLTAGYLTSDFEPDGGQRVEAFGDPEIVEEIDVGADRDGASESSGPPAPVRRLRGGRGWARILPDGSVGESWMSDGVEYRDGEVRIRGEQGSFDLAAGSGQFYGAESDEAPEVTAGPTPAEIPPREPLPRVTLVHPRGELVASTVGYTREDGVAHARGGVSTVLQESLPLLAGASANRDGDAGAATAEPTRVESAEAFFRDRPRGALFRGDVRAWQGESVVLAEWLRADEDEQRVSAGGGVRTVAAARPTPERPDPAPLTVTANQMTYVGEGAPEEAAEGAEGTARRGSAELIYEGEVRAVDQGRDIACDRLEVLLGEDGEAERLTAVGSVVLQDSGTGKEARAQRAAWRPGGRPGGGDVALSGDPAVVTDARGGEIKAPELLYEMATGRVRAGTAGEPGPEPVPSSEPDAGREP